MHVFVCTAVAILVLINYAVQLYYAKRFASESVEHFIVSHIPFGIKRSQTNKHMQQRDAGVRVRERDKVKPELTKK